MDNNNLNIKSENKASLTNFNSQQTLFNQQDKNYEQAEQSVLPDGSKKVLNKYDKPLKIFGGICILLSVAAFILFPSTSKVDTSEAAKNALKDGFSTSLSVGTVLMKKDENIGQKDYTISHKSNEDETKIWIWDYAAEDGDYVQVIVNGAPLGDTFMIKNKPKEFIVPAIGNVQVKGIRDGGGGITYAVRYDLNGTNYFNSAPEGKLNTYTLVKE